MRLGGSVSPWCNRRCLSIINAAMAAACGAAAEVPKKFGKESGSVEPGTVAVYREKKKVVFPPSGAVTSGFKRTRGFRNRSPLVSKRIGTPPAEENVSRQ